MTTDGAIPSNRDLNDSTQDQNRPERFVIAPVSSFQDFRLTLIELRILLGLFSFRSGSTTNTVWPSRATLAKRVGYSPSTVSRAITGLVQKQWLTREQHRGPNTYKIHAPSPDILTPKGTRETVTGSETVTDPETVTGSAINSDRIGNETVTGSVTPKEIKKRQEEISTPRNGELLPSLGFEEWWKVYPKKSGKKNARRIWDKRKLDRIAPDLIKDVEMRKAQCRKWREGFIMDPSTYLNGDRWEDEIQSQGKKRPTTREEWLQWGEENNKRARGTEGWDDYIGRLQREFGA